MPGKVEGRTCQITIDTGSNISIVRPDMIPEQKQSEIQPVNQCIRTVTGEKAPIRGKGKLHLRIGSTEILHPTWIADIQDECILGLDFLEPHECLVNLKNGTLQIGEEEIPLQKPASVGSLTSCRAVLETTVILPPQSECVVSAKVDGQDLYHDEVGASGIHQTGMDVWWSHPGRVALRGELCSRKPPGHV